MVARNLTRSNKVCQGNHLTNPFDSMLGTVRKVCCILLHVNNLSYSTENAMLIFKIKCYRFDTYVYVLYVVSRSINRKEI
jgi:hypothetical protein